SAVKDAETGQRGFLLTGSEDYLAPYNTARASLPSQISRLRQLVAGSPRQLQRVDTLQRLTTEKLTELAESVSLRRAGKGDQAMALMQTDIGKSTMDDIRSTVADALTEERSSLLMQQQEWQNAVGTSAGVTIGGAAVLLVLIGVAAFMMSREHRAREV